MSGLFPAVHVGGNGNVSGRSGLSVSVSSSRASVRARAASSASTLPALPHTAVASDNHYETPAVVARTAHATKTTREVAQVAPVEAVNASTRVSSRSALVDPESDLPPALGLRIVDARFESVDGSPLDQPTVWSQLRMDSLNAGLASPLTAQEVALNSVHRRSSGKRSAEALAAEAAHRAIDVSKLVAAYPLEFGTALVGGAPRVLFMRLENVARVAPPPTTAASELGVTSPLATTPGEVCWRARLPPELETSVAHWASQAPEQSDEDRYHLACVDREIFTVRPNSGRLAPGQSQTIEIVYHPKFVGAHVLPLLVQVRGGKHFSLVLRGQTAHHLPMQFAFHHLEQDETPAAPQTQSNGKHHTEESKEQSLVPSPSASSLLRPFLPSPFPSSLVHSLHSVPIGLSVDDTPEQTFPLFNPAPVPLAYRVSLAPLRALARDNYDVEVLTLAGADLVDKRQTHLEGEVASGETALLRLRFRPIEARAYTTELEIGVRPVFADESEETVQRVRLEGSGLLPSTWALTPFPSPSSTAPPHQPAPLPGQLLEVSCEEVRLGDLPLFAVTSRLLTLRAAGSADDPNDSRRIAFSFEHALRVSSRHASASLLAARALRRSIAGPDAEEAEVEQDELEEDPLETVDLVFTPPHGLLRPGESVQVRIDAHAGSRPIILERDVRILAAVIDENQQGQQQFSDESPRQPDVFGLERTSSTALAQRVAVSSSQPAQSRLRRTTRARDGRVVECVTGVGTGRAGTDVRVDYPPARQPPLQSSTITKRTGGGGCAGVDKGEHASASSAAHTQHLARAMSALGSVPARATWFADASAPVRSLSRRTQTVHHLFVRARVLPLAQLERDAAERAAARGAADQTREKDLLPQQRRTDATAPEADVEQRFFVPRVELVDGQGASVSAASSSSARVSSRPLAPRGVDAVESAFHALLRDGLDDAAVRASFAHLRAEPVPLFADLLDEADGKTAAAAAPTTTNATISTPSVSLAATSGHFQNLAESLLRDTFFHLAVEASSATSDFGLDRPLPKTFVKRSTTQTHAR